MTTHAAYQRAKEQVQLTKVQWQASIVRSESFAVRRRYAEAYGLALAQLARLSIADAIVHGSTKG
jgi:hypothetical protein